MANKIKRTQINRRTKRVKKTRSQKKIQRTSKRTKRTKRTRRSSRNRRSFLKNKRKTQKRKRVLRGGMEAGGTDEISPETRGINEGQLFALMGEDDGSIYSGVNQIQETLCNALKRKMIQLSTDDINVTQEDIQTIIVGMLQNILKCINDCRIFLQREPLPELNKELFKEFMLEYYPQDYGMVLDGVREVTSIDLYRYIFQTVYKSGNFKPDYSFINEDGSARDLTKNEVIMKLLTHCQDSELLFMILKYLGNLTDIDTLLSLGDILFPDCYHTDLSGVMGTFLESIQNNPNSTEFIFMTMKKFERMNYDTQEKISKLSGFEKVAALGKDTKDNYCERNIKFLRENLYQSMERYFPGFVFDPNKYFTYLARTDLEEVPIGASGQREEAARAAGATFGFEGEMGGRNQFAEIIEYAIKNNLYTESFQEIMDKYFMEEIQKQAEEAEAPRPAISKAKAPASQTQSMAIPGGASSRASGSKGEPDMSGASFPGTTPPQDPK